MNHKKLRIVFILLISALLVGLPSWLIYREVHHEYLDRELITAIKNTNASRALDLLQEGADGDARDIPEPQSLSLTQQIIRIFHRKSKQEILQREHAPTALWLLFNYSPEDVLPSSSPYHIPWKSIDRSRVLEALLRNGARVNQNPDGTPLCWAARLGDIESMQVLLKYGADPNKRNADGRSALFYAEASIPAVQWLLAHGAKSDVRDNYGKTVLRALYDGGVGGGDHEEVVLFWIQNGADVNTKAPIYLTQKDAIRPKSGNIDAT